MNDATDGDVVLAERQAVSIHLSHDIIIDPLQAGSLATNLTNLAS